MSDPRYENVGELDDKVIEECSELIMAIIKAKRFGLLCNHPLRPDSNNLKEIQEEIKDCLKIINKYNDYLTNILPVLKKKQTKRINKIYAE